MLRAMTHNWDLLGDRLWPFAGVPRRASITCAGLPSDPVALLAVCAAAVSRYTGRSAVALGWWVGPSWRAVTITVNADAPLTAVAASAGVVKASDEPLPAVTVGPADAPPPAALLDIRADGTINYASDLYTAADVERFAGHLRALAAVPGLPVGDVAMLGPAEIAALSSGNATDVDDDPATLVSLIAEQVRVRPDTIAVRDNTRAITYAELWAESGALATSLEPRGLVGVWCRRDATMLVGLVAVLRAGAAYVALEPRYPAERLRSIAAAANLSRVLGDGAPDDLAAAPAGTATELDAARPDDLAYVMFTSGSTGTPKGVAIEHRNVVNTLRHMALAPGLAPGERMLGVTTPAFDLSVPDLFLPLITGATLLLADPDDTTDGRRLAAVLGATDPQLMQATPATWRMLLDAGWAGSPRLRIVCGGEGYDAALARRLAERVAAVWNFYGPTETTVWSVCRQLPASVADPVPMGRPMRGTACFVLDDRGQLVPPGVRGELHIAGAGVARGYLGRPDLTASAFVPAAVPGVAAVPSARMYRTGDLVRVAADGELTFAGRRDLQVKVNGFRVELGEVETIFGRLPGVRQAVAVVRSNNGVSRLICYVVGEGLVADELRERAAKSLAPQAIPAVVVVLDELPLTRNGKVDRAALPEPVARSGPAPDGVFEELVAEVFAEVLGHSPIHADDDLFALGAYSLDVSKIAIRLTDALAYDVTPGVIFRNTSVSALAAALVERVAADETDLLVAVESE